MSNGTRLTFDWLSRTEDHGSITWISREETLSFFNPIPAGVLKNQDTLGGGSM